MRDDVKDLFNDLLLHLDSRKKLLNLLLENEKATADFLKNRNDAEDDILIIIETQTSLIDEINIEDYNISQIKDEINRKYNFDMNKVFREGFHTSEFLIMKYRNEILLHEVIINRIIALKKQNLIFMEKKQKDLKTDIIELERMNKLKIVIPKDLQHS